MTVIQIGQWAARIWTIRPIIGRLMNTNNLTISYSLQTDKMSKVTDARLLGSNQKQSVTMNVNMKSYFGENSSGVIRQVKKTTLDSMIEGWFFGYDRCKQSPNFNTLVASYILVVCLILHASFLLVTLLWYVFFKLSRINELYLVIEIKSVNFEFR